MPDDLGEWDDEIIHRICEDVPEYCECKPCLSKRTFVQIDLDIEFCQCKNCVSLEPVMIEVSSGYRSAPSFVKVDVESKPWWRFWK